MRCPRRGDGEPSSNAGNASSLTNWCRKGTSSRARSILPGSFSGTRLPYCQGEPVAHVCKLRLFHQLHSRIEPAPFRPATLLRAVELPAPFRLKELPAELRVAFSPGGGTLCGQCARRAAGGVFLFWWWFASSQESPPLAYVLQCIATPSGERLSLVLVASAKQDGQGDGTPGIPGEWTDPHSWLPRQKIGKTRARQSL